MASTKSRGLTMATISRTALRHMPIASALNGRPAVDCIGLSDGYDRSEYLLLAGRVAAAGEVLSRLAKQAKEAQKAVRGVAAAISEFVPVTVVADPSQVDKARSLLPSQVLVLGLNLETPYIRDTAPLFVKSVQSGIAAGIDYRFNLYGSHQGSNGEWITKWGSVYAHKLHDAELAQALLSHLGMQRARSPMVLEGGSVHTDGEGTMVTTAECLLHENRNPNMTREQIEAELQRTLGVTKVIWLPRGVYADWVTNGHCDNFCCFVRPGHVLLAWTDDTSDPQWEISQEAYDMLSMTPDAQGRKLQVHKVPMPPPLHITQAEADACQHDGKAKRGAGERLPASYINFYHGNGGAVIPAFGVSTDEPARLAIQEAYGPSVKVVSVPARPILMGGGDIHCMTMHQAKI